MSGSFYGYVINNVCLSINASVKEAFSVVMLRLSRLGLSCKDVIASVFRRSIDARRKNDIKFVYSIAIRTPYRIPERVLENNNDIVELISHSPEFSEFKGGADERVVVVGSGPCGMFCALALAENGYPVTVIERGDSLIERSRKVELFKNGGPLDISSNIQFGAGGAGTFSDGKLVTRINDAFSDYVLRRLCDFGAPEEILYLAKPHIGTDILSGIVDRILNRITKLGGEVLMNTTVLGIRQSLGRVVAVKTDKGEIPCTRCVLAIGHSARDTYTTLINDGLDIIAKPFSVGMRIEHPAAIIDRGLFGDMAGHPALGHGEYNLSYNTKKRGVYTFCMCPGGEVVAAASELGGVAVNGMSHHARDGKNSNSAVVCSVFTEDYGGTPLEAIEFQRMIERKAFCAGGSNYHAPITTVSDFLSGRYGTEPTDVIPTYMNGNGVKLSTPESYLPEFICSSIRDGIKDFDKKLPGFAYGSAILTGAETRTSAPVRILRDSETKLAKGYSNLYPSGEGAGYAGGITSAAIDGLRTAIAIMNAIGSDS